MLQEVKYYKNKEQINQKLFYFFIYFFKQQQRILENILSGLVPSLGVSLLQTAAAFIWYQFLTASEGKIASETGGHCPAPILTLLWRPALSPKGLERGMVQTRAPQLSNVNCVYLHEAVRARERLMAKKNFLTSEEESTFILIPWKFIYVTIITVCINYFPLYYLPRLLFGSLRNINNNFNTRVNRDPFSLAVYHFNSSVSISDQLNY